MRVRIMSEAKPEMILGHVAKLKYKMPLVLLPC